MSDIFTAYSKNDAATAERLVQHFRQEGWEVFIAQLGKKKMLVTVITEQYVAVLGVISNPGIYARLADFGMTFRKSKVI